MESYYYCLGIIVSILLIIGVIWFILSLFRIKNYERKINKLHSELEVKIEQEKDKPVSTPVIEGRIKNLKENYEPRIKELERNKKFILDKLPFIK